MNQGDDYLGKKNYNEPKHIPKYLLVFRWTHSTAGHWVWQYVTQTFDNLDAALEALNPPSANEIKEHDFIGLWELRDDALVPLTSERTERIRRTIREDRITKTVWSIDNATN